MTLVLMEAFLMVQFSASNSLSLRTSSYEGNSVRTIPDDSKKKSVEISMVSPQQNEGNLGPTKAVAISIRTVFHQIKGCPTSPCTNADRNARGKAEDDHGRKGMMGGGRR